MKGSIQDIDAQRSRWERYRATQFLVAEATADTFAQGGLAANTPELDVRVLVLPTDPFADVLAIDDEVQEWWKTDRSPPYGGPVLDWGQNSRAAANAIVRHSHERDGGIWNHYLGLHRHGGVEAGRSRFSWLARNGTTRFFVLRPIVAMTWSLVSLQREVQERWSLSGPFEVTVALRGTRGAGINHFAEGWRDPSQDFGFMEVRSCLDEHVLLRMEIENGFEAQDVAMQIGDRVENAFGTTHRRHIANRGDSEGRFDPRFTF